MGAGVDSYNGYGQRGAFHIIERQMAAAVELFPVFARAHLLRSWGGIVDVTPDASPDRRPHPLREPVPQLRLGHRRLQGHTRRRLVPRRTPSPTTNRTRSWRRSASTASSPGRSSTSTAPPPSPTDARGTSTCNSSSARVRAPRGDRVRLRRPGPRRLPRRPGRAVRRGVGRSTSSSATTPRAAFAERWSHSHRLPPLVQRGPRHRHLPLRERLPPRPAPTDDDRRAGDPMTTFRTAAGGRIDRGTTSSSPSTASRSPATPATPWPRRCSRTAAHQIATSVKLGRPRGITAAVGRGPERPGADRGALPRADAAGHDRRALRRARRRRPAGPGPAGRTADTRPYDDVTPHATCSSSAPARPGWPPRAPRLAPVPASSSSTTSPKRAALCCPAPRARRRPGAGLGRRRGRRAAGDPEVLHLQRTTAFGSYDDGFVLALERRTDHLGAGRPGTSPASGCGASGPAQIVVATGAHERPVVFADNDRPGHHARRRRPHLPEPLRRARRAASRSSSPPTTAPTTPPSTCTAPGVGVAGGGRRPHGGAGAAPDRARAGIAVPRQRRDRHARQ